MRANILQNFMARPEEHHNAICKMIQFVAKNVQSINLEKNFLTFFIFKFYSEAIQSI